VAGHKGTEKEMLKLALCDEEFPSARNFLIAVAVGGINSGWSDVTKL
jgi:hypothetical protein